MLTMYKTAGTFHFKFLGLSRSGSLFTQICAAAGIVVGRRFPGFGFDCRHAGFFGGMIMEISSDPSQRACYFHLQQNLLQTEIPSPLEDKLRDCQFNNGPQAPIRVFTSPPTSFFHQSPLHPRVVDKPTMGPRPPWQLVAHLKSLTDIKQELGFTQDEVEHDILVQVVDMSSLRSDWKS
jgi:hypothetical protein